MLDGILNLSLSCGRCHCCCQEAAAAAVVAAGGGGGGGPPLGVWGIHLALHCLKPVVQGSVAAQHLQPEMMSHQDWQGSSQKTQGHVAESECFFQGDGGDHVVLLQGPLMSRSGQGRPPSGAWGAWGGCHWRWQLRRAPRQQVQMQGVCGCCYAGIAQASCLMQSRALQLWDPALRQLQHKEKQMLLW